MTRTRSAVSLVGLVVAPLYARAIEPDKPAVATAPPVQSAATTDSGPIGVATREPDGTLVLTLRAEGEGGAVGDAQIRYAPSDPAYPDIARHLGPIPAGGSVPVRPFEKR